MSHHALSTAILDSGASGHYLTPFAKRHCTDIEHTTSGPSVQVATGTHMESSTRAAIPLAAALSRKAQVGHIFDDLTSGSLISIGQLCDNDCVALFSKYHVDIIKAGKVIIKGRRNTTNGLWTIPLAPKTPMLPSTLPSASHQTLFANSMI
jgi:hypothetical protein